MMMMVVRADDPAWLFVADAASTLRPSRIRQQPISLASPISLATKYRAALF